MWCAGNSGHLPDTRRKHRSGGDTTFKAPSSGVWTWFVNGFVFEKELRGPVKTESPKPCGVKVFDWNFSKYAVLNRTSTSEKRTYASVTSRAFHMYPILLAVQVSSISVAHSWDNKQRKSKCLELPPITLSLSRWGSSSQVGLFWTSSRWDVHSWRLLREQVEHRALRVVTCVLGSAPLIIILIWNLTWI